MSFIFTAIIGGGAAIGGALISANASQNAAQTQANAANQASQVQQNMFNTTQQNAAPWLQAGQASLSQLSAGTQPGGALTPQAYAQYTPFSMSQFQQDPGYQFQLQQGQNALTNQESISGGMNSNNLKSLLGFSQGLANSDYQTALGNYMNQFNQGNTQTGLNNQNRQQQFTNLSNLSQTGANAGQGLGTQSANVGSNIGNNIVGAGVAQSAGQVGVANALQSGLNGVANNSQLQQYLQQIYSQNNGYGAAGYGSASAPGYSQQPTGDASGSYWGIE